MINPYDLGSLQLADTVQKIQIDQLINQATKDLKQRLVEAQIESLGVRVRLTTSKTRFNGERLWFVCPVCSKRSGVLYRHSVKGMIGCRCCLAIKYRKQRYKGMIEENKVPVP